jgi:hypothetical protein
MTKTSKSTKIQTSAIETEIPVNDAPIIRFVDSEIVDGSVKAVIFTPKGWNGSYANVGLFEAVSAFNAITEFLGGSVQSAGMNIHIHNPARSKYDGIKKFYLGGNIARVGILDGQNNIVVHVGDSPITVGLPKTDELIGEWVQVFMKTSFTGRVAPCTNNGHVTNMAVKHDLLEKLFSGTKLVIFTDPTVVKDEVYNKASNAAVELRTLLLNEDGTLKTQDEIMEPYYAKMREYSGDQHLDKVAARVEKMVEKTQATVIRILKVDDVEMDVAEVPTGWYQVKDRNGFLKEYKTTVTKNMDSERRLLTCAMNSYQLSTIKRF